MYSQFSTWQCGPFNISFQITCNYATIMQHKLSNKIFSYMENLYVVIFGQLKYHS